MADDVTTKATEPLEAAEAEIASLARRTGSPLKFYRGAFLALVRHLEAVAATLKVGLESGTVEESFRAEEREGTGWDDALRQAELRVRQEGDPVAALAKGADGQASVLLAVPIETSGVSGNIGVLVLICKKMERAGAREQLARLRTLSDDLRRRVAAMEARAETASDGGGSTGAELDHAVARAASYASFSEFAFAMVNNLRARVGADQVGLGLVRGKRVKVAAVSMVDDPNIRSPGTNLMRAAMEECCDRREPIFCQREDEYEEGSVASGHRLHRRWGVEAHGDVVASFPLLHGEEVVGVVSLRRPPSRVFDQEEADRVRRMLAPLGSGVVLLRRADRNLLRHALSSFFHALRWMGTPRSITLKLFLLAVVALGWWVVRGSAPYDLPADAALVAKVRRQHAAPFEGVIESAGARDGDRVEKGQVLLRLDTKEVEMQRAELVATIRGLEVERRQLALGEERHRASELAARIRLTQAKLDRVEDRIRRSQVNAAIAGVVIEGDLDQRVGQMVARGDPLCEIASLERLRLEIRLPEDRCRDVEVGAKVRFASQARPEAPVDFRVTTIRPYAEVDELKNVFVIEAEPTGPLPAWLLAGVEGSARIEAGRKPVWWLAFHRVLDNLRLEFWL